MKPYTAETWPAAGQTLEGLKPMLAHLEFIRNSPRDESDHLQELITKNHERKRTTMAWRQMIATTRCQDSVDKKTFIPLTF